MSLMSALKPSELVPQEIVQAMSSLPTSKSLSNECELESDLSSRFTDDRKEEVRAVCKGMACGEAREKSICCATSMKFTESAENSVAFGKAPRRGWNTRVSHFSQPVRQSVRHAGSQAGRQAGRQKHPVWFLWRPTSMGGGEHITCSVALWLGGRSARLSHADSLNRIPGRQIRRRSSRNLISFCRPGFESLQAQTSDPPTTTPTP